MFAIIVGLLMCQQLSASWSTPRLPLEVYELTPVATASQHGTEDVEAGSAASAFIQHEFNYLKHKHLEYATASPNQTTPNANRSATATAPAIATTISAAIPPAATMEKYVTGRSAQATNHTAPIETTQQQLEQRRSRQMLDIIEQHEQQQKQHTNHNMQQKFFLGIHGGGGGGSGVKHVGYTKDVRILYQVGNSEDDLPICAPNAVCSKIDLYETPWIERQCRCPASSRQSGHIVVHHHHHAHLHPHATHRHLDKEQANGVVKYRSYYEREKLLQQKRLLVGGVGSAVGGGIGVGDVINAGASNGLQKFESVHLKKLMQKLGAVYAEDLHLPASDETAHESENDALPPLLDVDDKPRNKDFASVHGELRRGDHAAAPATHMRHSGYAHRTKGELDVGAGLIGGCPSGLSADEGHTIADKTRHYKLCQPVHQLPVCKHFRDYTWTLRTSVELNVTEQIVHCRCPRNSVTYLTKREPATSDGASSGYTYLFACSPVTRIRCQRKQPCKLFTVRKRQEFLDEVNINALCQCPKNHHCPSHHTQSGVIPGESYFEDNIQTYSGYCMAND